MCVIWWSEKVTTIARRLSVRGNDVKPSTCFSETYQNAIFISNRDLVVPAPITVTPPPNTSDAYAPLNSTPLSSAILSSSHLNSNPFGLVSPCLADLFCTPEGEENNKKRRQITAT